MLKIKNLKDEISSLEKILKEASQAVSKKEQAGEDGRKLMVDLLFQFMEAATGYLNIAVIDIDKYRSSGGSPHSGRMPSASQKIAFILGKVGDKEYYYRHPTVTKSGALCAHLSGYYSHQKRPRTKIIGKDTISVRLARALAETIVSGLKQFADSGGEITVHPHGDFVIRCFIPSTDESMGKWKFFLVRSSRQVTNHKEALTAFSSREGDHWKKKLGHMERISIYPDHAGGWIAVKKDLHEVVSPMDIRVAGVTPVVLTVAEQSATV